MTLYIVRHGRTEANASGLLLGRADPELDEEGRKQAQQISTALPEGAIVVSSPLQRTRQTAEAVDPEHLTDDRLLEMDYGVFDLTPVKDVPADVWAQWRSDPDFAPPDGESHARLPSTSGRRRQLTVMWWSSPMCRRLRPRWPGRWVLVSRCRGAALSPRRRSRRLGCQTVDRHFMRSTPPTICPNWPATRGQRRSKIGNFSLSEMTMPRAMADLVSSTAVAGRPTPIHGLIDCSDRLTRWAIMPTYVALRPRLPTLVDRSAN